MWIEQKRLIALVITILIIIEIYFFSTITGGVVTTPGFYSIWISRAYHFIIFFLLTFFLMALIKGKNKMTAKYLLLVLIISITYAFSDEFHQTFIPGREGGMKDVLTDSLGIFFSVVLYTFIDWKERKFKIKQES